MTAMKETGKDSRPQKTGLEILRAVVPEPTAELIYVCESPTGGIAEAGYVANDANISVSFQFTLPWTSWLVQGYRKIEMPSWEHAAPDNYRWPQWLRQRAFEAAEKTGYGKILIEHSFSPGKENQMYEVSRETASLQILADADEEVSLLMLAEGKYRIFNDVLVYEFPFWNQGVFIVPQMVFSSNQIGEIEEARQGHLVFKFNPFLGLNRLAQEILVLQERVASQQKYLNELFDYWQTYMISQCI